MDRIQKASILKDLEKKLVFLVGPRQVGKTWLAKNIASDFQKSVYLNYDKLTDQEIIRSEGWLPTTELLILDELHKMDGWKNYLKGVFDTKPDHLRILVTGSSRLDIFDQMGDSLAGRYFKHRLMPISLSELSQCHMDIDINRLLELGGFPEPYLSNNLQEARRWRQQYSESMLSTDVFEFDAVHNLKAMRLIFEMLRHRVGSTVSYQSISEDVAVSPLTVKKYIQILEALYIIFRVTPYSKNIARSLLKEPKIYFFDTGLVEGDEGAKLENLVAVSLLKHTYGKADALGEDYKLHYLRTKDDLEVDFALVNKGEVEQMIEVKLSDGKPNAALKSFYEKYKFPAIQLVKNLRNEHILSGIEIRDAQKFLTELFI